MNQGQDRSRADAAAPRAADACHVAGVTPSSSGLGSDSAAAGFWNRVIHALAFAPEIPQFDIRDLPLRTG